MGRLAYAIALLGLAACGSAPKNSVVEDRPFAELIPQKLLYHLHDATSLVVDQFRNVYVVQAGDNSLIKLSGQGDSLRAVIGVGSDHYQFNDPVDVGMEIVEGEERYLSLGATVQGRVLLVVTTWREDRVRVVTAFEPIKRLIQFYYQQRER